MDGAVMDVIMEYAGWRYAAVAGRYRGVAAYSATSRQGKRNVIYGVDRHR